MQCRELEDNLSRYFKEYEFDACAEASATDDWSRFRAVDEYHQKLLEHISPCSDCANSLLWYLSIKGTVDYQEYPCLHLTYFCNDEEHRCIERWHNTFSIILNTEVGTGIVIGHCPWCGIKLNVGIA